MTPASFLPKASRFRVDLPVDLSLHVRGQNQTAPTIKVRAVLSWNTPPSITHPYAQVVWGNSLDLRIAITSQPVLHSSKEAGLITGNQHSNSACIINGDDREDHGPSFTRSRWKPVDWMRHAASF